MTILGISGVKDRIMPNTAHNMTSDVVEMMRALGYPRLLSMENFRSPNFKLVAELLEWIVRRFDPNSRVSTILDTEQERVIFIKTVVLILLQKARIKLNPRKLYQADGYAVQELSVVIRVLYDSTKQPLDGDGGAVALNAMRSKVNIKMQEIRTLRQLASQIPQSGATLYDLLSNEVIAAEARSKALSFSLDLPDAEKAIKSAIDAIQNELAQVNRNVQNISSDEATLDATVERKKKEYDQQQKRLAKLQSFRPQYMDEYEKYEKKLKQLYAVYVLKFRNVAYLQQLQTEFDKAERQRNAQAEQAMRNMVERMRADEIAIRSRQLGDLEAEDQNDERSRKKATKVFGNMTGAGLSDDEEDDDEDLENGQISDDDSERFLEDGAKIKEDSLGEAEETTEDKFDVSSGDDF